MSDTQHLRDKIAAQVKTAGRKLNMAPFREALGGDTPDFPLSSIGRYRLLQVLRFKFGAGYKNVSKAKQLLALFDREKKLNEMGV
jgi:hypothetical protein